jgi:hypothetical protein
MLYTHAIVMQQLHVLYLAYLAAVPASYYTYNTA